MSDSVVIASFHGKVVKACENWKAYDDWVTKSTYSPKELHVVEARVREE